MGGWATMQIHVNIHLHRHAHAYYVMYSLVQILVSNVCMHNCRYSCAYALHGVFRHAVYMPLFTQVPRAKVEGELDILQSAINGHLRKNDGETSRAFQAFMNGFCSGAGCRAFTLQATRSIP